MNFSKRTYPLLILLLIFSQARAFPTSERAQTAIRTQTLVLKQAVTNKGLKYGSPIFIRIFKQEKTLELWMENNNNRFELFKTYEICKFSGELGPKQKQGDWQSPEGFYFVNAGRLNPWSRFHLSFNLGYPNAYDRYHGRTGSALMIHGNCVSIGCYAMTDAYMEEIYTLSVAALKSGQAFFRVHVFPFHLSDRNLDNQKNHRWYSFWKNLKTGYDHFEKHRRPPNVTVIDGEYHFELE